MAAWLCSHGEAERLQPPRRSGRADLCQYSGGLLLPLDDFPEEWARLEQAGGFLNVTWGPAALAEVGLGPFQPGPFTCPAPVGVGNWGPARAEQLAGAWKRLGAAPRQGQLRLGAATGPERAPQPAEIWELLCRPASRHYCWQPRDRQGWSHPWVRLETARRRCRELAERGSDQQARAQGPLRPVLVWLEHAPYYCRHCCLQLELESWLSYLEHLAGVWHELYRLPLWRIAGVGRLAAACLSWLSLGPPD